MWLDLDGLHIGTTTLVAHPSVDRSDDAAEPDGRLDVLLAVAFRKRLDGTPFSRLHAARALSRNGDQASANIRLAMANLVRIPSADDLAARLAMADSLLAKGLRPKDLLEALGLGSSDFERRYNGNQPRVPAGNGRRSGEFGSGSGSPPIAYTSLGIAGAALTSEGVVAAIEATAEAVALAAPEWSFLSSAVSASALASLAVFAAAVGAAATFGALFVPSPNAVSSKGSLPGTTSHTYDYNQDEGLLRVADGTGAIVAAGRKDRDGIFHDADTGVPFARALDGAIVFDADAIKEEDTGASVASTRADAEVEESDEPKLCPPAAPEIDNKASLRSIAYQEQINHLIRPVNPLPFRWTPIFYNPVTGKLVRPDNCDEADGSVIEAKGLGHAGLLTFPSGRQSLEEDFYKQALREVQAAQGRRVRWYFAEDKTAAFAADLFSNDPRLSKIEINVVKALVKWI